MRRTATMVFVAGVAAALLAGCSDDDNTSATGSPTPTMTSATTGDTEPPTTEPATTPGSAGQSTLRADCAGVTSEDLAQIFGSDFENPTPSSGGRNTFDNIEYRTVGCSFETGDLVADDESIEVDVNLSFAEQFGDNVVQCIEPSDRIHPVTPVDGLGNQAWWQPDDFENSADAEGELTICVDEALIGIEIEAPKDLAATLGDHAVEIGRIVVG